MLHENNPSDAKITQLTDLTLVPLNREEQARRLSGAQQPEVYFVVVSWVGSTSRSSAPASLHLLALQLKPSLSGL